MACNRCKGTSSDPFNFLLSCSECQKNWHHRCHIPPLDDQELIALIRATNDNDVDNGLSSWIGRCCRRKRVRTQAIPEAPIGSVAPSASVVRSLSVSADPDLPADADYRGPPHKAAPLHGPDLKQRVATPDERVDSDVNLHNSGASEGFQTISVRPAMQHAGVPGTALLLPDTELPHPAGQSTSFSSYVRPAHLHESSMTLERESSGQLAGFTHVQAASPLSSHPTPLGDASHASTNSMSMEINPPTLDLRALSLNRAPGASKAPSRLLLYRTTTSRPPSPSPPPPVPPVKSEDDEMGDLYGPSLGLPSSHTSRHEPRRRRSLSPQLPAESEPRVLPVLAAKDPHVLAMLEGQERREAARQRRGTHKAQAVRGAGKRRAGFVLVEGLTARRAELNFQALFERKRNLLASFLEATRD